jgi:hypothetical protein
MPEERRLRDFIAITTINSLYEGFQAQLELCREQEGDSISRMLGRLGEIDAMMHVTKSGTMVQVTWTEEENPGLNRLVRLFGRQWKIMSSFFSKIRPASSSKPDGA